VVPRWDNFKYCNKVRQITHGDLGDSSRVILLDCDMLVTRTPPPLGFALAGKAAEWASIPYRDFVSVFREASLPLTATRADLTNERIAAGWFNGGVLVFGSSILAELRHEWPRWIEWIDQNVDRPRVRQHIFEVSLALAIASAGWQPHYLDRSFNYPVHKTTRVWKDRDPVFVHYHDHFTKSGKLRFVPRAKRLSLDYAPRANRRIRWINNGLADYYRLRKAATGL
jgi:hypothetical protein